jgi:purine catabolism regulator
MSRALPLDLQEAWDHTLTLESGLVVGALTSRINRIERLTNLSMASPDDRAIAWLAMRALSHRGIVI